MEPPEPKSSSGYSEEKTAGVTAGMEGIDRCQVMVIWLSR